MQELHDDINPIIFCDGCDIGVHIGCYGIDKVPEGQWFCWSCKMFGALSRSFVVYENRRYVRSWWSLARLHFVSTSWWRNGTCRRTPSRQMGTYKLLHVDTGGEVCRSAQNGDNQRRCSAGWIRYVGNHCITNHFSESSLQAALLCMR